MYLFFDVETTGRPPNMNAPLNDFRNWPRIVQIAWVKYDQNKNEIERKVYVIKPQGFSIPDDVVKIHGITTEYAMEVGVDISSVIKELIENVKTSEVLISHNAEFDIKIISSELLRVPSPAMLALFSSTPLR